MFHGKSIVYIIVLCLVIRIFAFVINYHNPHFNILQDNYVGYCQDLITGKLNVADNADSRLFPGYPILMIAVSSMTFMPLIESGLFISILSSILSILLFNRLIKNKIAVLLFSVFPPVWILSSVKIATEPLTVLLLLISVFLFLKKKYYLSGLILGLSTGVRLISICLLLSFIITLFKTNINKILFVVFGFISTISIFVIYNQIVFGNIIYQFLLYPKIGGASGSSIGIIQLINDIPRSLDWHQYRILLSGFFYIALTIIAIFIIFKYKDKNLVFKISFYWLLFSLIFILAYGPAPLLEEFSRFLIPCMPAIIIGITAPAEFYKSKIKIFNSSAI
jgi:hypothetical protein